MVVGTYTVRSWVEIDDTKPTCGLYDYAPEDATKTYMMMCHSLVAAVAAFVPAVLAVMVAANFACSNSASGWGNANVGSGIGTINCGLSALIRSASRATPSSAYISFSSASSASCSSALRCLGCCFGCTMGIDKSMGGSLQTLVAAGAAPMGGSLPAYGLRAALLLVLPELWCGRFQRLRI